MVINSSDKSPFEIRDSTGKEFKEIYDNQERLLFKNWNEIQGSPPITFRGYGKNLTECRIYGNTVQNGIPSPEALVDVVGCGVRMAQLFDKNTAVYGEYLNEDGTVYQEFTQKTAWLSDYIPVAAGLTYTLNRTGSRRGKFFKADKTPYQTAAMDFSGLENMNTFTIPETVAYIRFTIFKHVATPDAVMLNAGSTVLPYEPYGYKLPLTVNGVEYPIYLGQVESTRKIKKLVLDGTENWGMNTSGQLAFFFLPLSNIAVIGSEMVCTHYPNANIGQSTTENGISLAGNAQLRARPDNLSSFTVAAWKYWLENNRPVVYYVLAEPETGVVNEPLQKIGDYSDELSIADIPTINGINTISADTTVQPSEMYIKGKIKPVT